MKFKFLDNINKIEKSQFEKLNSDDYPFLKYEFLFALEQSNSVCTKTGWQPHHLVAYDGDQLIGFMPLYLKTHSYGEYVFDFQWANAYHQNGMDYYPKLINAIPFTPCTGPRVFINTKNENTLQKMMLEEIIFEAKTKNLSSYHILFPEELPFLDSQQNLLKRTGMQYHWFNNDYKSFGEFLSVCKMKSRKNIKRERKNFVNSDIKISTIEGTMIDEKTWRIFYQFYCSTYAKRSGNYGYLNLDFFINLGKSMPSSIVMLVAELNNQPIAMSLFFKDDETLYGRYWGCQHEVEFLHFELCYYQGIEYCINNNLKRFDAGAQGEHKISRGFRPIETTSFHWIEDPRFREAINDFLNQETPFILSSIEKLAERLPFK